MAGTKLDLGCLEPERTLARSDYLSEQEDESMAKKAFNPDGLPVPRGSYSLVNVAQPGRMVFIAGQTASDHDGKVVGVGDAKAQTRFILGKIQRAVEAAGGTINDVVALNVFTTDVRNHRDINETRREVLGSNFPTSTMVQVVALARPELLLEINAVAVIP
ncbi:MAG TPA: RidA family protein [Candidatus Binatia bacterium]